jgi:small conductance mechanosensitive channel
MDEHGYLYDLLRKMGLTDFQASTGEFLLVRPLKIAVLVLAGFLLARLATRMVRRFARTLHARSLARTTSPRAQQRATTIGDVLANLVLAGIWIVVALLVLGEVGLDLAPLVAGAGVVGVALGFGAQSLVRDFLSGLFIILEDQYGVGDVITVKDTTGTVEDVSLRVTRFRAIDGTVWYMPNGEIRGVGNASMEWSRALIDVVISYDNDAGAVARYVSEVTEAFAQDSAWDDVVLEPPEVLGLQAVSADGLTIRVAAKTAPGEQYAVARELRARISDRLRREGVWGPGQSVLVSAGELDAGAPPPPPEEDS